MLKEISSVKISGANFKQPTILDLFNPTEGNKIKTIKGTLLYGKNGSGKSTIARGFRKIAGEASSVIGQALALDKDGSSINLSEDEKKHIFVFDEEYVDKNVKLHEDHLDTIVMLGEQVDLTEKIKKAEEECSTAKIAVENQEKVYQNYCDYQNIKSPKYYLFKLRSALQGDDSWAGRDKEIRSGRQNTGVKDDTYKQFLGITPSKSKSELILEFQQRMQDLNAVKVGASVIEQSVPAIPEKYNLYNESEIQMFLAQRIERPELSEREQYLFRLVQQNGSHLLWKRIELLEQSDTVSCPYCLQKLTPDYKKDLIESIRKILSKVVENHKQILRDKIWGEMYVDLSPFTPLKSYQICESFLKQVDEYIKANNELLQQKIDNPYEPIRTTVTSIQPLLLQLSEALSNMEKERVEYNKKAQSTAPIIKELTRINAEIAYYDIIDLATQYNKQRAEQEAEEKKLEDLKALFGSKKDAVQALEAQRNSVTVALDVMNNYIKYIFFEEDRLKIEYDNGTYKLLSHGQSVKPCDISLGERNVIGLCYYFTSILRGKEEKDAYNNEYLIIIDDPISSYDMENRIGILSFLKYELSVFLETNINTKALIMTHDLMAFYDIHRIFEEIMEKCKQKGYVNPPKFNCFELNDESLVQFQYKNRQEYTELIQTIYAYGQGQADNQGIVIGNIMHQTLEAFSTFEFKKGIDKISTDDNVLSLLGCSEYRVYFKNLMYRLVLHGGSHKEDQVKSMKDMNFFTIISEREKKRTAKDILCFIYLLNKAHLLSHLKDIDSDAEAKLDSWCQDIQKRSVVI